MNRLYLGVCTLAVWLIPLSGCQKLSPQTQISRYRLEITNGIDQAFSGLEDSSSRPASTQLTEHYVSPDGKLSNEGTMASPWDLRTALSHPKAIKPGHVVWLRGGAYKGAFLSDLIGNKGAPIIVRQYPGERATLDGCATPPTHDATLLIKGEYTWYWGFEVTNCNPMRVTKMPGPDPADMHRGTGVDLRGTDIKLINLVIHDTGGGIGAWTSAKRSEISGNVVYYNGFDGPDRGHGHGIYVQNQFGPKHLLNNVVFHQFGSGIHAYAESGSVATLHFEGNIVFSNGSLSAKSGFSRNLLLGGHKPAEQLTLQANSTYYPLSAGGANSLGYNGGCKQASLQDNYLAGPDSLTVNNCTGLKIHGNTFMGSKPIGFASFEFPDNVVMVKPTGTHSDVRLDRWEPGRAFVVVYNWERKPRLNVDISKLGWRPGQAYRLRSVEDYFADGIRGVFDGESLEVPMVGWSIAAPVGMQAPPSTLPEFGAFVIEMDTAKK